jgi:hypothetical protein
MHDRRPTARVRSWRIRRRRIRRRRIRGRRIRGRMRLPDRRRQRRAKRRVGWRSNGWLGLSCGIDGGRQRRQRSGLRTGLRRNERENERHCDQARTLRSLRSHRRHPKTAKGKDLQKAVGRERTVTLSVPRPLVAEAGFERFLDRRAYRASTPHSGTTRPHTQRPGRTYLIVRSIFLASLLARAPAYSRP